MFVSNCLFGCLGALNWLLYLKIKKSNKLTLGGTQNSLERQINIKMITSFLIIVYLGLLNVVIHLGVYDSPLIYWGISVVVAAAVVYSIPGVITWFLLGLTFYPVSLFLKRNWFAAHAISLNRFQTEVLNEASYMGILLFIGYVVYLFQKRLSNTLENLRQSRHFLLQAQNVANIGVYSLDINLGKWESSTILDRIFGIDKAFNRSVEGWASLIHPEDHGFMLDHFQNDVLGKHFQFNKEYRIIRQNDDKVRWLHGKGELEFNLQSQPTKMIGTIQDITERKIIELELVAAKNEAEAALKTKATFLDIAAHELRTPITTLALLLDVLQKENEKGLAPSASIVIRFRKQVDRLTGLVLDLLDMSRLDRGIIVLRPERTNLVHFIKKCVEEFRFQFPSRRFSYVESDKAIEIEMDTVRIHQVLSNLVDNANKYTPTDSPIEIKIEDLPEMVRVSVIDCGQGISKEIQEHLFTEFFRGNTQETNRADGLGLGLSVCRGIMDLHGGKIGVLSELGKGSTFYFELYKKSKTA